jgi:membrane-associated phospholipid phosphatase
MTTITHKRRFYSNWAEFVSDVISPPVVWAVMAFVIASRDAPSTEKAVTWALVYIGLLAAIPTLYILIQVRRGNITDMHMPRREERIRPFLVAIASGVLAVLLLNVIGASAVMRVFMISSLVQLILMALISTVWQISVHTMSISAALATIAVMFNAAIAILFTPLIALVALARLRLHRHTPSQVIAGIVLGSVSVGAILALAGLLEPGLWAQR